MNQQPSRGPGNTNWPAIALIAGLGLLLARSRPSTASKPTGSQHKPLQSFRNGANAIPAAEPEVVDISVLDPVERIRFIAEQQAMMHQTQGTNPNSWVKWGIAGVGILGGIKWLENHHPEVLQSWLAQPLGIAGCSQSPRPHK